MVRSTTVAALAASAFALLACGPESNGYMDRVSIDPASAENACGASEYQWLISQPESAALAVEFPGPVRIIHEDEAVTLDYVPERTNIRIDAAGLIADVYCG